MTHQDDTDRELARWLHTEAARPVPLEGLDRVLDATRARRPRPAWLAPITAHGVGAALPPRAIPPPRSLPVLARPASRLVLLVALLAVLLLGAILGGTRLLLPPSPPDRLGRLAFSLGDDIHLADWDGRHPVPITDQRPSPGGLLPACRAGSPGWSPDGRSLAYRCPGYRRTMTLSDREGRILRSFPSTGWEIAWSPDSRSVAAWIDPDMRMIGIHGLDAARDAILTVPTGLFVPGDHDPRWSPDGASVLIPLTTFDGDWPWPVWELPIDGGTPRPVAIDDPRSQWEATWSADGATVAWLDDVGRDAELTKQRLVVAAADGSRARVLVDRRFEPGGSTSCEYCVPVGSLSAPLLSPDGDWIAVSVASGKDLAQGWQVDDLYLVDAATGALTVLVDGHGTEYLQPHAFSPDGAWLLFSRSDLEGQGSLWSIRPDGSDARLLVDGATEGDWQWLPAGE